MIPGNHHAVLCASVLRKRPKQHLNEDLHQLLDLRRNLWPNVLLQLSQPVDSPHTFGAFQLPAIIRNVLYAHISHLIHVSIANNVDSDCVSARA